MKVLIIIACSIIAVNAVSFYELFSEEWHFFKNQYRKNYSTDEEEKFRFKIFMDNKHKIQKHNKKFGKGEVTFELGVNEFSDMLLHEFVSKMNGYRKVTKKLSHSPKTNLGLTLVSDEPLPDFVNWTSKGAVTPVKNQKYCGSCWAFSTTGALEAQHFLKKGFLVSLSEQNLVDCSTSEGNLGCKGGYPDAAFSYVIENGGIDTERSYPYEARDDKCRFKKSNVGAKEISYVDLPSGNETALQWAVANIGPVSVAIDASSMSFMHYKGGVFYNTECSSTNLDHAVLVVGYGVDEKTQQPYWLVKNSWGEQWGENGYVRMVRNADNSCGIATQASYPVV